MSIASDQRPLRLSKDDTGDAPVFDALMAEVMAGAARFGHREHVHLTWLAVRRCGVLEAVGLVSDGIQRTARYAGAPQKYHATISQAMGGQIWTVPKTIGGTIWCARRWDGTGQVLNAACAGELAGYLQEASSR